MKKLIVNVYNQFYYGFVFLEQGLSLLPFKHKV